MRYEVDKPRNDGSTLFLGRSLNKGTSISTTPASAMFIQPLSEKRAPSNENIKFIYWHYTPKDFKIIVSQQETEAMLMKLHIEGLPTQSNTMLSVDTIQEYLHFGLLPGFFLQGLGVIAYGGEAKKMEGTTEDIEAVIGGLYEQPLVDNVTESKITIFSRNATISPAIGFSLIRPEYELMHPRSYIGTLTHEIGHNAHALLDNQTLQEWESLAHQHEEALDVDWYPEQSRKGKLGNIAKVMSDAENFAETFRLLVTNPGKLQEKYPKKYEFMLNLFLSKMDFEQQQKFTQFHAKQIAAYHELEANFPSTLDTSNMETTSLPSFSINPNLLHN